MSQEKLDLTKTFVWIIEHIAFYLGGGVLRGSINFDETRHETRHAMACFTPWSGVLDPMSGVLTPPNTRHKSQDLRSDTIRFHQELKS